MRCCRGRSGGSRPRYRELFGEDLPPIAYAWGGSFASTRDGLPFIGRVPGMHPRLQFALCYGGNGITFSVHAGEMIRAGIEGRAHELATCLVSQDRRQTCQNIAQRGRDVAAGIPEMLPQRRRQLVSAARHRRTKPHVCQ